MTFLLGQEHHAAAGSQAGLSVVSGSQTKFYTPGSGLLPDSYRSQDMSAAFEIHDLIIQKLFSASLIADVLPRLWELDPSEGRIRLGELRELTQGAMLEMQSLLGELRDTENRLTIGMEGRNVKGGAGSE